MIVLDGDWLDDAVRRVTDVLGFAAVIFALAAFWGLVIRAVTS